MKSSTPSPINRSFVSGVLVAPGLVFLLFLVLGLRPLRAADANVVGDWTGTYNPGDAFIDSNGALFRFDDQGNVLLDFGPGIGFVQYETYNVDGNHFIMGTTRNTDYDNQFILEGTVSGNQITGTYTDNDYALGMFQIDSMGSFVLTRPSVAQLEVDDPSGNALANGTGSVNFGDGYTSSAAPGIVTKTLTLKNSGTSPIKVTCSYIVAGLFEIKSGGGAVTLAAGGTSKLVIEMISPSEPSILSSDPAVAAAQFGQVNIVSDDSNSPVFNVILYGTDAPVTTAAIPFYFTLSGGSPAVSSTRASSAAALARPNGSAKLTVTPSGRLTGKVDLNGVQHAVSGEFDALNGAFHATFGNPPVPLNLQLESAVEGELLSGSLGSWSVRGYPAAYQKGQPVPEAGRYQVLLQAVDPTPNVPPGTGRATLTVSRTGAVKLSGKLPDGSSFSSSGALLAGGSGGHHQYIFSDTSIYGRQGLLSGTITFEPLAGNNSDGTLTWARPPRPRAKAYAAGFSTTLTLTGIKK